jgi:hypothetical protein
MDLAQTQKMNSLIGDLRKSGRVDSFDDAVSMAGNIYDAGLPEAQVSEEGNRVRELELRIRSHLSNVVTDINAELSKIWQVLEEMRKPPQPEVDSTAEQQAQEEEPQDEPPAEPEEQPPEAQPQQESGRGHPRNGSYNSEDVDLEKFFYFGQK